MNTCMQCDKWKEKQEEILMKYASIFDIAVEMQLFEDTCIKTCPYLEKDTENS